MATFPPPSLHALLNHIPRVIHACTAFVCPKLAGNVTQFVQEDGCLELASVKACSESTVPKRKVVERADPTRRLEKGISRILERAVTVEVNQAARRPCDGNLDVISFPAALLPIPEANKALLLH